MEPAETRQLICRSECAYCDKLDFVIEHPGYKIFGSWRVKELEHAFAEGCQSCGVILKGLEIWSEGKNWKDAQEVRIYGSNERLWKFEASISGSDERFEIFTTPETKAIWRSLQQGYFRQMNTGSELYLDYILPWADKCAREHKICYNNDKNFMPIRILDIGITDADHVSLVETEGITQTRYISLSHCWGASNPLRTTKANIQNHKSGIPLLSLPQTFQDAVKITRHLNIRYLWIDSLCIVQDDKDDWVTQSAQMAEIFGKSFLTISATISNDATSGIFRNAPYPPRCFEIPHPLNPKVSTGVFVRDIISHHQFRLLSPHAFSKECEDWDSQYPLLGRAWAYQEHLLSPRIVYFGHHELFWQCNEKSWCCCSPHPVLHGLKSGIAELLATGLTTQSKMNLTLLESWERVVRYYSSKSITKEEDRLPALSGIVKRFQAVRKSQYFAGLWEDNLASDLCWSMETSGKRPSKYLAPSWSWCSVFGNITGQDSKLADVDVEFHEISCLPMTSDPTGSVSSGSLRLSGFVLTGKLFTLPTRPDLSSVILFENRMMQFDPDALQDDVDAIVSSDYTLHGLYVGRYDLVLGPSLYILILLQVSEDRFRRVGIALTEDFTWRDRFTSRKTITIE